MIIERRCIGFVRLFGGNNFLRFLYPLHPHKFPNIRPKFPPKIAQNPYLHLINAPGIKARRETQKDRFRDFALCRVFSQGWIELYTVLFCFSLPKTKVKTLVKNLVKNLTTILRMNSITGGDKALAYCNICTRLRRIDKYCIQESISGSKILS